MKLLAYPSPQKLARNSARSKSWDDRWDDELPEFTAALLGLGNAEQISRPALVWVNDFTPSTRNRDMDATPHLRLL